ncbi:ABC transporter ATP-binding protein [Paenibacillus endoradicis]|uniref:ABC transporter ATP-binding protein n=1 Tax=Paenibacillus endoradicis TaxID=2972487 RepID=UPI0021595BF5|nr:ABC transporter ATP-binding protein [Paenibacillus endoradicis]MCR8659348.1 ABC transporter ATP-binding protein [Paenibacillus endoradicis]
MGVSAQFITTQLDQQPVVAIELDEVTLRYGSGAKLREIISPLKLSIEEGSFVCVLGPSGCGKTSILRMLAGYLSPTEGNIELFGRSHVKPGPEIGVVFQHSNLFPWLTVQSNVAFGLKMAGISKIECKQRTQYILEQVGLAHAGGLYPHQLSGGMKQRVALARTLITEPSILLMDEPFAALDAITRETLQLQLKDLWSSQKRTIFFITHDVDEALLLGTRVIVLSPSPGSIKEDIHNTVHNPLSSVSGRQSTQYAALRDRLVASLKV